MGLDIFFHRVVKVRKSKEEPLKTINDYTEINNKRWCKKVEKFVKKSIKDLENAQGDNEKYAQVYNKIFPGRIKKMTYYEYQYRKMLDDVKPLDEVKSFLTDFAIRNDYAEHDAYFRKVNFVYAYFQHKLEDEMCFVTKQDLEDLIDRCNKVLADKENAYKLLPTQSGFFFGSTDYDKWYFDDVKDVRRQMKKLLKGFNEDTDIIYVIMSW